MNITSTRFNVLWNKVISILLFAEGLICQTVNAAHPDSVYIFPYASVHDNGRSGLKFVWSTDCKLWHDLAEGTSLVRCDFNPVKQIYRPYLLMDEDNTLHFYWFLDKSGEGMAHTFTSDLIDWRPQDFYMSVDSALHDMKNPVRPKSVAVQRGEQFIEGWALKVPYKLVDDVEKHQKYRAYIGTLRGEKAEHDQTRFAGLETVKIHVNVNIGKAKPISENLIGVFFEDLNYAADGGLYAELIQNRDFEYSSFDGNKDKNWNSSYAWQIKGEGLDFNIATYKPVHPNNSHYAMLNVTRSGGILVNTGWDGIVIRKGEKYDFSVFTRSLNKNHRGRFLVRLVSRQGEILASESFSVSSSEWKKQEITLTARKENIQAQLEIIPQTSGRYALDMISLFPRKTFKGRKNGLRADLAQAIADIRPRFVRFPGGCLAHGDGLDNIYNWKETIGPLETRKPLPNIWRYHQTRGLGYYEYFQFCEDIGAEPLPVVAAGVSCQNSSRQSKYSVNLVTSCGQQGGLPRHEMQQYVQDVLDLIEYANGDAKHTKWGRERAKAGHPEPFHLKYIGVGNEDLITPVFKERFRMIYDAIKEKYPDIVVIGTTGPFSEGSDYNEGWRFADELKLPMVDEHNYNSPGWFIYNQDYYDNYDRTRSKVYLGEYAAHLLWRPNNMETALAEALFLTSVERNGDVVSMTSYAPLLAKEGYTQWKPDLIYFNNTEVKLTTDYYVQQMFGQNLGNEYLPSDIIFEGRYAQNVQKRIGISVVRDSVSGDFILKMVNMLPVKVEADVNNLMSGNIQRKAEKIVLSGQPVETFKKPVQTQIEQKNKLFYELPPYSFTIIRIKD